MILRNKIALVLLASALPLGGCVQAQANLAPDYGVSLRQNIAAQIADPDARYDRDTPPAASGSRATLAHDRYNQGKVIQPTAAGASSIGGAGAPAGAGTP